MGDSYAINTKDLRNFGKALWKVDRKMGTQLRRSVRASAEIVAVRARELAYSEGVAGTIKAGALGGAAYVSIGNDDHPEAKLLEVGNGGSARDLLRSSRSGSFKHPVFGTDVWVEQPMHPCLGPAAKEKEAAALLELSKGVNKVFADVHLEME